MKVKLLIKILISLIIVLFVFVLVIFLINKNIKTYYKVCDENMVKQAALVLGARVWSNGQMSDIFKDRVKTASKLYKDGKVKKILVSGDHGREDYDEVNAAKDYLLENNIPDEDIFLDHAGFDTYDSVYRARSIFEAESLIIVTQDFHLSRALYIADKLDIDSCGISADLQRYYGESARNRREALASVKAWFNIFFNSRPRFLGEKIPLSGDGRISWD